MRIAFILPGFSRDADDWAIPALQTLAIAMAREHDLHVFSLRYPAAGRYLFEKVTHHAIGGGRSSGLASIGVVRNAVVAVIRQHRRTPFDVLHAFWADEPGLAAVIAAARLDLPVVVSLAGGELVYFREIGYGTQGSLMRRLIIRIALSRATAVTVGSLYEQRLAHSNGVRASKAEVIPIGVDTRRFRPGPCPDWQTPTIIQAASLTPIKNQALLVPTLRHIKRQIGNVRLVLAGTGPLAEELTHLVDTNHLRNNFLWSSNVPHEDMPHFYRQGHLYLQTSIHEAQGMSVLEALASGLPVFGTPAGILPEVACQPPSWSDKELARQAVRILGDEKTYSELRRVSRELAEDHYSLSQSLARFVRLYRSVC